MKKIIEKSQKLKDLYNKFDVKPDNDPQYIWVYFPKLLKEKRNTYQQFQQGGSADPAASAGGGGDCPADRRAVAQPPGPRAGQPRPPVAPLGRNRRTPGARVARGYRAWAQGVAGRRAGAARRALGEHGRVQQDATAADGHHRRGAEQPDRFLRAATRKAGRIQ